MDVVAVRAYIGRLTRFSQDARHRWPSLQLAAARAQLPVYRTAGELDRHLDTIDRLRDDLTVRVDLMEIVNDDTGCSSTGFRTLDLPHGDSLEEVRTQLGHELARVASELDLSEPAAVAAFNGQLSRYLDDSLAMGAFFEKLGPAPLLGLVTQSGRHYAVQENLLLRQLKDGLQTADVGWPPAQRQAFADALADSAVAAARSEPVQSSTPVALALLLRDGRYSTEFLGAMATALDAFERTRPDLTNPLSATDRGWSVLTQSGQWPPLGDPIPALMSALANNPAAAFAFFTGPDKEERAAHYFQSRSSGMGAIASAVDVAATAFYRQGDPRAEQSAWIASAAVFHFGARYDIDLDAKPALGHLLAIHLRGVRRASWGIRGGLGTLPAETRPPDTISPPIANFPSKRLTHLLSPILTDPDAVNTIGTAMNGLTADELDYGAARWSVQDGYDLDTAVDNSSTLTGFLLEALELGEDAELAEQEASAEVLISFGRAVAGSVPIPIAGPFGEYAFDQAVAATREDVKAQWARTLEAGTGEARDDQAQNGQATIDAAARTNLKIAVAVALMRHGHVLTDDSSANGGKMTDPRSFPWMDGGRFDPSILSRTEARDMMLTWIHTTTVGPMGHYSRLINAETAAGRVEYESSNAAEGSGQ